MLNAVNRKKRLFYKIVNRKLTLNSLKKQLQEVKALPGHESQLKMLPQSKNPKEKIRHKADEVKKLGVNHRESAVMLLIYPDEADELHFCLTKRHDYNGAHSGQICLPGGKRDEEDESLWDTASRECFEEVGIKEMERSIELSPLYVPVSSFIIHPFVGFLDKMPSFQVQESEVNQILSTPLVHFLDDERVKLTEFSFGKINLITPYFDLHDEIVWGATAGILSEFKDLIKSVN